VTAYFEGYWKIVDELAINSGADEGISNVSDEE
jgi:hypothetical protein